MGETFTFLPIHQFLVPGCQLPVLGQLPVTLPLPVDGKRKTFRSIVASEAQILAPQERACWATAHLDQGGP